MERIFKGKSPRLFVGAVFVSAISNFYFFYMIVILTVIYVVVRMIPMLRSRPKESLRKLLHLTGYAVLAAMLSAAIVLPVMYAFLSRNRASVENGTLLFYPLSYYSRLPGLLLSSADSYWMCMGFGAVVLPAILLLFLRRKENKTLKIFFLICVVIMLCPYLGQALNGFSYISNRWSWAFALVCAYTVTTMWPELFRLTKREMRLLCCGCAVYLILCLLLDYSLNEETMANIAIALIILLILFLYANGMTRLRLPGAQMTILALTGISIISHGYWKNAYSESNYAAQAWEIEDVTDTNLQSEARAVKKVAASEDVDDFYRYSGKSLTSNAGTNAGLSSTSFFWSISNPYSADFRSELGLLENSSYNFKNYDNRTSLTTLASVLYYVMPAGDTSKVPYGFTYVKTVNIRSTDTEEIEEALREELGVEELTEEQITIIESDTTEQYAVYRNDYALPLAYTYECSVGESEWETWNEVQQQDAMLRAVVVADEAADTSLDPENEPDVQTMEYEVTCNSSGVTQDGNSFVVTKSGSTVTLSFEGMDDCENYLIIHGLDYDDTETWDLYFGDEGVDPLDLYSETTWELLDHEEQESIRRNHIYYSPATSTSLKITSSEGDSRTLTYYTPYYSFYSGREDFAVCLDYSEDALTTITITFDKIGIYTYDELLVVCEPMDNYAEEVDALCEDTLDGLYIDTDYISGYITLGEDKWLCFSIPYSEGWTAYVDGEEVELYQANIQYMAIQLQAGEHTIELTYHTPYLRIGIAISACGAALIFAIWALRRRYKRLSGAIDTTGHQA